MKKSSGYEKQEKVFQKLSLDISFLDEVKALRETYGTPKNGFVFEGNPAERYNQNVLTKSEFEKRDDFNASIDKLMDTYKKHGLNHSYRDKLVNFILFNVKGINPNNVGLLPNWHTIPPYLGSGTVIEEGEPKRLLLEIYGNTTLDDIKNSWDEIETYRKQLPDYDPKPFRVFKNAERDMNVIEIYLTGETDPECIADFYNDKYLGHLSGAELMEQMLTVETVADILKKHSSS